MAGNWQADVEKTFQAAAKHRDVVARIRKHARDNPEQLATRIVEVVPVRLREVRAAGLGRFGIDLADPEAVGSFATHSVAEWQIVAWLADYVRTYGAFLSLVGRYAADPDLTALTSARAVCEAFLEATERHLYAVASNFDELRRRLPGQDFAAEELTKVLSGVVATRTSLHRNLRLRGAIDELRNHSRDKSAKRERFEQLLDELPAQVLDVWDDTAQAPSSLSEVRTRAVRRLEGDAKAAPEEMELAAFTEQESLLKLGKSAGLSPQEFEVFKLLLIRNPKKMTYKEIASRLGMNSTSQVGVVKHRISRKLGAAELL